MAYYTEKRLIEMGFKYIGHNVKISDKACIYDCEKIEIGDNSRIDDFCVISGKIKIGRNVHIAPFCLVGGGEKGIVFEDFSGLAYQVQVFTQSDDYSGEALTGNEEQYVLTSMKSSKISGDGEFSHKCQIWFEEELKCKKALLTTSCTHALEIVAILLDIKEDDEVIMPSYTFVSTANSFVLRGAKIVFVDIRPDTMNINETKIEQAITKKTKIIVPVHYAGVACEMDVIMELARKYDLFVVEDAAQGMMSSYKGKTLGTIGDFGTYSFHETKNYTSAGEGGLLIINDDQFIERAEVIKEKGTNRSLFFRGMVDKYSWVDIGSSYLMNDMSAAYLWGQLEKADEINDNRLNSWNAYYDGLKELEDKGLLELPTIPDDCVHNAHMFYIKVKDLDIRTDLIEYLKQNDIWSVFHYVPLHSAPAGLKFGRFEGIDDFTTVESERLIRLPMYYGLSNEILKIVSTIKEYFH